MEEKETEKITWLRCPQMRRENTNAGTVAHGVGGFSAILPEVQIYLRDIFQEWKNRRNQNAGRLLERIEII